MPSSRSRAPSGTRRGGSSGTRSAASSRSTWRRGIPTSTARRDARLGDRHRRARGDPPPAARRARACPGSPGCCSRCARSRCSRGRARRSSALLGRLGWLRALSSPLFAGAGASLGDSRRSPTSCVRPRSRARPGSPPTTRSARGPASAVPCARCAGSRDVFAGEADAAAFVCADPRLQRGAPADAGHFANVERPDAVLAAIAATRRAPGAPRCGGDAAASLRRSAASDPAA